jgi:hypothetical protein
MSRVNSELLALFEAHCLREREACIAHIRAVVEDAKQLPASERPDLGQFAFIVIDRIRRQP